METMTLSFFFDTFSLLWKQPQQFFSFSLKHIVVALHGVQRFLHLSEAPPITRLSTFRETLKPVLALMAQTLPFYVH